MDALLGAVYPERKIRVVNMGCGGHTVRDLKNRWQTDVLDLKPDWVSIMIGDNDVWRQFDSPLNPALHVLPDEYESTLESLVAATLPQVRGLVLMTPFYIEPNPQDAMRARMDDYGAIARKIAERRGTLFCDTQAAFNSALQTYYPATFSWDRVHPNHVGHMILARAFCKPLVFSGKFEWTKPLKGCRVPRFILRRYCGIIGETFFWESFLFFHCRHCWSAIFACVLSAAFVVRSLAQAAPPSTPAQIQVEYFGPSAVLRSGLGPCRCFASSKIPARLR